MLFHGRTVKSRGGVRGTHGGTEVEQMELRDIAAELVLPIVQIGFSAAVMNHAEVLVAVVVGEVEVGQRGARVGIGGVESRVVAELGREQLQGEEDKEDLEGDQIGLDG